MSREQQIPAILKSIKRTKIFLLELRNFLYCFLNWNAIPTGFPAVSTFLIKMFIKYLISNLNCCSLLSHKPHSEQQLKLTSKLFPMGTTTHAVAVIVSVILHTIITPVGTQIERTQSPRTVRW